MPGYAVSRKEHEIPNFKAVTYSKKNSTFAGPYEMDTWDSEAYAVSLHSSAPGGVLINLRSSLQRFWSQTHSSWDYEPRWVWSPVCPGLQRGQRLSWGYTEVSFANGTGCPRVLMYYLICIQYILDLNLGPGCQSLFHWEGRGQRSQEQSACKFRACSFISTEAQLTRRPLPTAFITLAQKWAFRGHNQGLSELKSHSSSVHTACPFPFPSEHEGKKDCSLSSG